jgi:Domain found in IF2B/IF5
MENVLRRYVKEYVTCHTCRSPDTILQKETRLFFLQCETCGSRCSVASIKSGFQVFIYFYVLSPGILIIEFFILGRYWKTCRDPRQNSLGPYQRCGNVLGKILLYFGSCVFSLCVSGRNTHCVYVYNLV